MNDPLGPHDEEGTDLSPEEREGLIPSYITTRAELNEAEQANIIEGREWAFRRKREILDEAFLKRLHERLFGKIWRWAGKYRTSGKNIGIEAYQIPMELRELLEDVRYWIEHDTYSADEIATRFHHRLTCIHCFPNGNGRHARMATDLLLTNMGKEPFSWGHPSLVDAGDTRARYIAALRAADRHDIEPLLAFVRT